jgi:hypothetical protein
MVARKLILDCVCFFIMSFFFTINVRADNFYDDIDNSVLVDSFETKNCFASYVMIRGGKYLVKQKKVYKKQLAVVRDALAAYIAKDLAIAHHVYIIPSKKNFPGKVNPAWPATLHTIAPGETVRKQRNSKYNALRIKQVWAQAKSFDEKGLTRTIINYMTWHWQLPIIVALDLIIGNSDRHCGNLCYDPQTDTFCAIDMDDTFNKDLSIIAYKKLEEMANDKKNKFTQEELRALSQMKKTLKFLVNKYKPQDLINKLHFFVKKAGFIKGSKLYDDSVKKKISYYEVMIIQSNKSAHKLITLLSKIVHA